MVKKKILVMAMSKVRNGFTLLETVIGLTIFCALTLISLNNLKDYQARVEEKQALEWFKDTFKSAYNRAYLQNHASKLIIQDKNEIIYDVDKNGKNFGRHISRKLPKTLTVSENSFNEYNIHAKGDSGSVTIRFQSTLTHKVYEYKIQMGWGEIIETTT